MRRQRTVTDILEAATPNQACQQTAGRRGPHRTALVSFSLPILTDTALSDDKKKVAIENSNNFQ